MNEPYSILMQKMTDGAPVKDTAADFGIACRDFPFLTDGGTKELASRDWPGEDGEDVYIPARLLLKAYDIEAEMCYKGALATVYDNLKAFRDYLTGADGSGAALKIYNAHTGIGRQNVYLLEMGDPEFHRDNAGDTLLFTLKMHVADPRTGIAPLPDDEDPSKIVSLYIP